MGKTYVLSSEILETETPKNEKLEKIVTRKSGLKYQLGEGAVTRER